MEKQQEEKDYPRCLRCGRKLKNIDYRHIGYGAVCYEKMKKKQCQKKLLSIKKELSS